MSGRALILLIAVLTCGAAMPVAAQEGRVAIVKRGWLGFSFDPVSLVDARAGLVIRQVRDDSPAQRAGVQPGDTLLEVNGLAATPPLLASLGSSLAPGDRVRLRLRRGGRVRTLTLEAAERSGPNVRAGDVGVIVFSQDTLRRRLRLLADSLRVYTDTFRMPNVYFHWQDVGERVRTYWPPDSMPFAWDGRHVIKFRDFSDSVRIHVDSIRHYLAPGIQAMRLRTDSLFRFIEADSTWRRGFTIQLDSLAHARAAAFEAHAWPGIATLSMRAIAGAELTDLTPGLARAFDTPSGVLVLRVPEHSPARRAGLAEADVIVRANGTGVASVAELRRIVARAHGADQPARLEVLRDGRRVTLVLNRR